VTRETTITCYTLFDIPYQGSRSTTRNWNTLVQTLSLRTQPIIIDFPTVFTDANLREYNFGNKYKYSTVADVWSFRFTSENIMLYALKDNPVGALIVDANFVPMIDNQNIIVSPKSLITAGELTNIYFVFK
jgi:hypothetical protein